MKKLVFVFLISLFGFSYTLAQPLQVLFYTDSDTSDYSLKAVKVLKDLQQHAKYINIISPQVYQVGKNGVIWGSIDQQLLNIAKQNNIKVMPLITNANFSEQDIHAFLNDPQAQQTSIQSMVNLAKKYNFYGFQFDFEHVNLKDKQALTEFVTKAAKAMHENQLKLSIAVVKNIPNQPNFTEFDQWKTTNWSGAYDYQQLAKVCDFISIMTYDQHNSLTTPGPVAAYPWTKKILEAALKTVPANKISLGIPAYSGLWRTGKVKQNYQGVEIQIGYNQVKYLLKKFNKSLTWDPEAKVSYVMFQHNGLYEYLFVENAKSFQTKLDLAKQYHLRGISVWQLGLEDPKIWNLLQK